MPLNALELQQAPPLTVSNLTVLDSTKAQAGSYLVGEALFILFRHRADNRYVVRKSPVGLDAMPL
jgi:hypothetical protein